MLLGADGGGRCCRNFFLIGRSFCCLRRPGLRTVGRSGLIRLLAVLAEPPGFVHGFTYSHHVVGAAVAGEVLRILEDERLVEASAVRGERLRALLDERLGSHPHVGEIRGRGLLVGLELVADRDTRAPFPRTDRVTERVVRAARDGGVLLYSGTGLADGTNGDAILLGPPLVVTDDELVAIGDGVSRAIELATTASTAVS